MNLVFKIIASLAIPCTLFACEQKPHATSNEEPKIEESKAAQKKEKKPTPFEKEIQKMLAGKKADEAVLRKFLKGKPKENNGKYLKQGVDHFVSLNGSKPAKKSIIDTLIKLNKINVEMRNEEALEDIEEALAEQLKKEQKR